MRRALIVLTAFSVFTVLGVAVAIAAGTPEVDKANATIQTNAVLKVTKCAGEDATNYETYMGTFAGGETDFTPGSTDYNLSGTFDISKAAWTINLTTDRGVLTGTVTLSSASSGLDVYSGKIFLITQGLPAASKFVPGRGWINASTYNASGAKDGGSLLANVEANVSLGGLNAQFGDAPGSLGFADWSVAYNNMVC